jgi:uncharacterized protein (DUF934 family)
MNRQALRIPAHNDMLVPNPTRPLERERIIWSLGQWRKRREEKRREEKRRCAVNMGRSEQFNILLLIISFFSISYQMGPAKAN